MAWPRVTIERWRTAYHEAGHAAAYLYYGFPFRSVAIEPNPAASVTGRLRDPIIYAVIALSGPVAESRYAGTLDEILRGVGRIDYRHALDALAYVDPAPPFAEIMGRAVGLVVTEWPAVRRLARELVQRDRLDYEDVMRLAG